MQWQQLWGVEKENNFCAECNNTILADEMYCKQHYLANVKWVCNYPLPEFLDTDVALEDTLCKGQVTFINNIAVCNSCNTRSKERARNLSMEVKNREFHVDVKNMYVGRKRVADHICEWTKRRK